MKWCRCLACLMMLFATPVLARSIPDSYRSRQAVLRRQAPLRASLVDHGFQWGAPVFIRLFKAENLMEVWLYHGNRFKLFRQYPVCTYGGLGPGPKTRQGDGRAPEGFYYVAPRQMNPYSSYHLAFNVGYPNAYDRCRKRTGSHIMVHGRCVSIGCFAMTDQAMEEIYTLTDAALRSGQRFFRVHIFPFVMSQANMSRYRSNRWFGFWMNLKEGYDWFFRNNCNPPDVGVAKGRYRFRHSGGEP
jgi:murein L,D-transpeptidase YafK